MRLVDALSDEKSHDADDILDALLEWTDTQEISLYEAQEEAFFEICDGKHVILNTPTGSGKSLVAVAAHFYAYAKGMRSYYTSPIKALVNEKFFALCETFGAERVGMLTGDASVNPNAPNICCTAEVLANMSLRQGDEANVGYVIMDEFHYYSDPERGWAWQVPLLTLKNTTFLLMSATLGDLESITDGLEAKTGRNVALVQSFARPVPLEYIWVESPIHETLPRLSELGRTPTYVSVSRSANARNLRKHSPVSRSPRAKNAWNCVMRLGTSDSTHPTAKTCSASCRQASGFTTQGFYCVIDCS